MKSHRVALLALALLTALAACSDDVKVDPATGPLFASGDTAYCLALGADYTNNVSTLAGIALPSLTVTKDLLHGAAGSDPVLRTFNDKIYILNRVSANVTVIDKTTFTVDRQFSTGDNSNPQDIAVSGTTAYVATLGTGSLQVWDLSSTATTPKTTVDLSSYDEDGVPDASSVAVHGNRVYVTLELLAGFVPSGKGKVVVIDTTSNAIVTDFDLTFEDPTGFIVSSGDNLLVATSADFGGVNGCIETIETGTPGLGDCLVANSDLMGVVGGIAVSGSTTYVTVSSPDFTSATLRSVSGGAVSASLTPATESPGEVAVAPSGLVVYSDTTAGGVRVYDPAGNKEVTTAALDIGLGPAFADGIVCLAR
jgi:DNA-binding beta-propeller fold protein YncE